MGTKQDKCREGAGSKVPGWNWELELNHSMCTRTPGTHKDGGEMCSADTEWIWIWIWSTISIFQAHPLPLRVFGS